MRKQKVLGTNLFLSNKYADRLRKAGYKGTHNQFRVICKCTSMADANQKCEVLGCVKPFKSGYYSETCNQTELDFMKNCDIAFCIGGVIGNDYISYEDLMKINISNK